MTEEMKRERLQDIIDQADDSTLFDMWNAKRSADGDYEMHYMDELNDHYRGWTASDILGDIAEGFSTNDDYFVDNGCYVESFNDLYDYIDDDELIDYIIDNDEDFGDDDIRAILDEEVTDEDEEE